MIIFGNVGKADNLAWNLLLYTKKSFLQKITFPLFRYHLPSQQLPRIAKFQFSADFCISAETRFRAEIMFAHFSIGPSPHSKAFGSQSEQKAKLFLDSDILRRYCAKKLRAPAERARELLT